MASHKRISGVRSLVTMVIYYNNARLFVCMVFGVGDQQLRSFAPSEGKERKGGEKPGVDVSLFSAKVAKVTTV